MKKLKLYNGDCAEVMRGFDANSIDLCVTSPPYDDLRDYKGYVFDFKLVAEQLFRVIKHGGVVVWIVNDKTTNGSESVTSFKQALFFKELGFKLYDTMIWDKVNGWPKSHRRYEQIFDYMFVFSKGAPAVFNPVMIERTQRFRKDIPTFRKSDGKLKHANNARTNSTHKVAFNIWRIVGSLDAQERKKHPATFPSKIARDHITTWTDPGALVLDPFLGSGTTAKMALETGRCCIGIEISKKYFKQAKRDLKQWRKNNVV